MKIEIVRNTFYTAPYIECNSRRSCFHSIASRYMFLKCYTNIIRSLQCTAVKPPKLTIRFLEKCILENVILRKDLDIVVLHMGAI